MTDRHRDFTTENVPVKREHTKDRHNLFNHSKLKLHWLTGWLLVDWLASLVSKQEVMDSNYGGAKNKQNCK